MKIKSLNKVQIKAKGNKLIDSLLQYPIYALANTEMALNYICMCIDACTCYMFSSTHADQNHNHIRSFIFSSFFFLYIISTQHK